MKFENLYRIIINEAEAIEDVNELNADTVSQPVEMGLEKTPETMSYEEKVDFFVKNHAWKTKNKTDAEKEAIARNAIDNGLFDSVYEGVMARKERERQEAEALEQLPPELETSEPTQDDIADISPALSHYNKEKQADLEAEEEFGGQD